MYTILGNIYITYILFDCFYIKSIANITIIQTQHNQYLW
jgi:hypothetical protein